MADTQMNDERARAFADALKTYEREKDVSVLTRLFAEDATTLRLDGRGERTGEVAQFWQEYRAQFDDIATTFYNVVEGGDKFALEWTSKATLASGRPIEYRGVTVIDLDGDRIVKLRTYYDSARFAAVTAETD
jgi:ketosteroid isomerase-like protein